MAYKVKFSKSAVQDLNSIQKYIYENNRAAAQKVVSHIINSIESIIAINPAAGRAGRILGTRELVINKYPYLVPYQVRGDCVYVLRVLHTSRKWEEA